MNQYKITAINKNNEEYIYYTEISKDISYLDVGEYINVHNIKLNSSDKISHWVPIPKRDFNNRMKNKENFIFILEEH